jgi:tetratricopeptide (TPR) repeat protein
LREGNLLQIQGKYDESIAKYDGALALDPRYKDALYREGIALIAMNKSSQAVALFDQILAANPNHKQAHTPKQR